MKEVPALFGEGRAHGGKLRATLGPRSPQTGPPKRAPGIWRCEEEDEGRQSVVGDSDSLGSPLVSQEVPKNPGHARGRSAELCAQRQIN